MNNNKLNKATYLYVHSFEKETAINKIDKEFNPDKIKMKRYLIRGSFSNSDIISAFRKEKNQINLLSILQSVDPHQKKKFEETYDEIGQRRVFRELTVR